MDDLLKHIKDTIKAANPSELKSVAAWLFQGHATYKAALEKIRDTKFASEYHDGSSTGQDAVQRLQEIAAHALTEGGS